MAQITLNSTGVASSGSLVLQSNGTTSALTIDTAQNAGLGVTPSAWWSGIFLSFDVGSTSSLWNSTGSTNLSDNLYYSSGGLKYKTTAAATRYQQNAGQHIWFNVPSGTANTTATATQAMTLDASGNLLVGKTSTGDSVLGAVMYNNGQVTSTMSASTSGSFSYQLYSTGASAYRFYVDLGGTIHATSTSITGISDRSLKTNIRDLETGLPQVLALRPRRFDWINGDAVNVAGFIAQEVENVLPELVSDYVYSKDEEGNDVIKKSLKMGDILPTLVKAVQEQQTIIESLTARITALEA